MNVKRASSVESGTKTKIALKIQVYCVVLFTVFRWSESKSENRPPSSERDNVPQLLWSIYTYMYYHAINPYRKDDSNRIVYTKVSKQY